MFCSLVLQLLKYFCTVYSATRLLLELLFSIFNKIRAFRNKNFDDMYLMYFQN